MSSVFSSNNTVKKKPKIIFKCTGVTRVNSHDLNHSLSGPIRNFWDRGRGRSCVRANTGAELHFWELLCNWGPVTCARFEHVFGSRGVFKN